MGARDNPLAFDEATHTYRFLGQVVPSVTQILRPLADFSGVPREVLEAKRALGQRVHLACQLFDEDDLDWASIEPDVGGYLDAWIAFRRDTGCEVLAVEERVCEPMLGYAGTLDRIILINGAKTLVDLKTSIATPRATGAQTAAYMRALGDNSVTHRAALRLRPDGNYRLDQLTDPDDWSVFMACLTLWRYEERHRG